MRDFGSCLGEYAVQISDNASCSTNSTSSYTSPNSIPSIQNSVTCLFRTILSNQKQIQITVQWCKNSLSQGLNITFGDQDSSNSLLKLNTNPRIFRKLKGSRSLDIPNSYRVEIFYDLSTARYLTGPEPVDGFYILITFNSEIGLIIGDTVLAKKVKNGAEMAKFSLITRQEHFSGNTLYSTKARFCETGVCHDIMIKCAGENEGLRYPVMSVSIDKKTVIRVKRLHWNFRGNQTIFLDGLLVDLMWDVHDWFYRSGSGNGVFMFRTRSGLDSRLWMEEKQVKKDEEKVEFSFVIYACKNM